MIEVRRVESPDAERRYGLYLDGSLVEKSLVSIYDKDAEGNIYVGISIKDYTAGKQLTLHPFSELPLISYLYLPYSPDSTELIDQIIIRREFANQITTGYTITFFSEPNLASWDKAYTFAEYCNELARIVKAKNIPYLSFEAYENDQPYISTFEFVFPFSAPKSSMPMAQEIEKRSNLLRELHEEVETQLISKRSTKPKPNIKISDALEIKRDESSDGEFDYKLFIDGSPDHEITVTTHGQDSKDGLYWDIAFNNYHDIKRLGSHTFLDLPDRIEFISIAFKPAWSDLIESIYISPPHPKIVNQVHFDISCSFNYRLPYWKKPYSIAEYLDELVRVYEASPIPNTHLGKSKDYEEYSFWLQFEVVSPQTPFVNEVERCMKLTEELFKKVDSLFDPSVNTNSIKRNLVEIRKNENPESKSKYDLFINGICIPEVEASSSSLSLAINTLDEFERLLPIRFCELPDIALLHIDWDFPLPDSSGIVSILSPGMHFGQKLAEDYCHISFTFHYDLTNWRRPYSYEDVFNTFQSVINELVFSEIALQYDESSIRVFFRVASQELQISDVLIRYYDDLRKICRKVAVILSAPSDLNSITAYLEVPEEVRITFEQYLVYFIQFLKDIGVEANSELKHEAGKVLFTVTPTDKELALDKIYTALKVYLRLPDSPISDSSHGGIEAQRLVSNIHRLKSDLALSQAMNQAKDATIQAQQLTIANQQYILDSKFVIESVKDVSVSSKDSEDMASDTLAMSRHKGNEAIDITDIFTLLRRLVTDKE